MARKRQTNKTPRRQGKSDRLLLVVDMLNGFLDPEGSLYCGDHSRKIVPFVRKRIEHYNSAGKPVVFICDSHEPKDSEFKVYGKHCVEGTWEADVVPELPTGDASVLHKKTLSPFYNTQLSAKLRSHNPDVVEVVGVCTDICVLFSVFELMARGYSVEVPRKGVSSFNRPGHNAALKIMRTSLLVSVT
ncbi:MAG: cysteine hydrolase family protein [Planctomycetota bacterium]